MQHTKIIEQLFAVFNQPNDSTMEQVEDEINRILRFNGLQFKLPYEIDKNVFLLDNSDIKASFYYAMNCVKCTQLPYFTTVCEQFIDFSMLAFNIKPAIDKLKEADFDHHDILRADIGQQPVYPATVCDMCGDSESAAEIIYTSDLDRYLEPPTAEEIKRILSPVKKDAA